MFDRKRLRQRVPILIAMLFLILGMGRPDQRGVWFALAAVFLLVAGWNRRRAKPPA